MALMEFMRMARLGRLALRTHHPRQRAVGHQKLPVLRNKGASLLQHKG